MDLAALQDRTGWTVHHLAVTESTNDVAARLVREGAAARTLVLADRQTIGRGREGRPFASPPGGLYVSLLLDAPPADLPGGVVALVAVAAAEAAEAETGREARIKWPNDIWIDGKKVGGILLELVDAQRPVVAGVGLNVGAIPQELEPDVAPTVSALGVVAGHPVERQAVLERMLASVDAWSARRAEPGGAEALEVAWRGRLALIGEEIVCRFAGRPLRGVLEDASLTGGLLIRDADSGPVWREAGHVQDLRAADRTIS
ncbi:MAG: biotin--[acetyl-CoA-carboxylase] ligase [Planctomycetota bacterium]|nr:biotin--[acetyl-CoA-carboxylase] ligase [Planctomycetota bacterium]